MTSSFDAYDLMRRSILSSIMGLKRKPRPPTVTQHPTGLFKFRQNRRSKKSPSETTNTVEKTDVASMDDVQSTASSTRSDDK
ncbi:unnamed protein product, partial [Nippostrongylus brasiliensis]|uniref:Uncharacterized protein n=1 Tax=Nippostrongylus brasiliensis TaxID=27835 RepID=A0A0N4XJG1_NIPBR